MISSTGSGIVDLPCRSSIAFTASAAVGFVRAGSGFEHVRWLHTKRCECVNNFFWSGSSKPEASVAISSARHCAFAHLVEERIRSGDHRVRRRVRMGMGCDGPLMVLELLAELAHAVVTDPIP